MVEPMKLMRKELSILLYVETRAVDYGGVLDGMHMNSDDIEILKRWDEAGFVRFGRIALTDVKSTPTSCKCYWCDLSDEAWTVAHRERKARAMRSRNTKVERLHHGDSLEDSAKGDVKNG